MTEIWFYIATYGNFGDGEKTTQMSAPLNLT